MNRFILLAFFLSSACSQQTATKQEGQAPKAVETSDSDIKERKKSIEEAADEAAKLVEADAKAEIDALEPAQ
jgi:PBP1b-binding outer membrane lipoprotein LpoB